MNLVTCGGWLAVTAAQTPRYYTWLMIVGLVVSLTFWVRLARQDERLLFVWMGALLGAFAGAKLLYFVAEGWLRFHHTGDWRQLFDGQSIVGAFLGGYATVEGMKRLVGYRQPTGDRFALIVPLSILLGRLGCWFSGCCPGRPWPTSTWWTVPDASGVPRWPAVPIELAFNLVALVVLWGFARIRRFTGNLFHLYLMAYGCFRFLHETVRDTPRLFGPLSGYALGAVAVAVLGAVRFRQRQKEQAVSAATARCAGG